MLLFPQRTVSSEHDGLWLASELQRDHPHTAVIVATGYTELLGEDAQQGPIADFLIKPFQRERFTLAVDRGRQWRKQALEEVHWHAMLSIELRDRVGGTLGNDVAAPRRNFGEAVLQSCILNSREKGWSISMLCNKTRQFQ